MALGVADYNDIERQYKNIRLDNERKLKARKEEVYSGIPEYRETEEAIISLSAKRAKALIWNNADLSDELERQIDAFIDRQRNLLSSSGFPADYLNPIYSCPECRDTGYVDGERCKCFKKALTDYLFEQSNMKAVLESENFDTLLHDLQIGEDAVRFEKAYSKALRFTEEFGSKYQNICFSGTVGTGKSFLSNCIMAELMKKEYSCVYYSAPTLFNAVADYKFRRNNTGINPSDLLYTCDLLVIDDLGTEMTNTFTISELLTLLNERDKASKATVISTNLTLEELHNLYDDRIFSRLFSKFEFCPLTGQDLRIYIKQMKNRK